MGVILDSVFGIYANDKELKIQCLPRMVSYQNFKRFTNLNTKYKKHENG